MHQFKFSLFRIFMAMIVFGGAFGFVEMIGTPWPICPWLIGVPLAMLMLVVKWKDTKKIVTALTLCAIGVCLGGLFHVWIMSDFHDGIYHPSAPPTFALIGVLVICFLFYFIIGYVKLLCYMRKLYLDEQDSKAPIANGDEIKPSPRGASVYDQAGTQVD